MKWLLVLLLACGKHGAALQFVDVKQDDLVIGVEVTGELEAVDSTDVKPPGLPDVWDYKISQLADEGIEVKAGDPLVGFDSSKQVQDLENLKNEAEAAQKKLEKKRDDAALARRDEDLKIAEAEATLRKASLKATVPPDLSATVDLEVLKLDEQNAKLALEQAKNKAEKARRADAAEVSSLAEHHTYVVHRVEELQHNIGRMAEVSPRAGTVVYPSNGRGEKKKVGDNVWRMEVILKVVALDKMIGNGQVDESEMAKVADKQPVRLRLDALPDVQLVGTVQSIAKNVGSKSQVDPSKVVHLKISLAPVADTPLRPGMRFRGEVETERLAKVVQVPADAVFVTADGPVAYRQKGDDIERVKLTLGKRSATAVQVVTGLAAGDKVSRIESIVKRLLITVVVLAAIAAPIVWFVKRSLGATSIEAVPTVVLKKEPFVRRVIAEGNLRAVKATPLTAPQIGDDFGAMKIAWLAADGIVVKEKDVVVRFDPTEPEKQLRDGEADLQSADAKLGEERIKSATAVADRDTTADLAGKELEQTKQFQNKDQEIFSRNQIIESEIDQTLAGAKMDHADKAKTIERHLSQSKASIITVEQQKARLAIAHARTALESMEIRAPHDGVLVLSRDWRGNISRVGDTLWPGQSVAEIPLLDSMEVEVFVLEVDGSGLAKGQKAEVRIEARPDAVFNGKVRLVDKLAKPRQPGVPVQYFAVVIELEKTDREAMKPGQRVHADLILDEESAIVVPRQAVFNKETKNVVYRRTATGAFDAVTVELGPATSGRVVVKSGLAEGDVIALRDPTRSLDQGSGSGSEQPK